jgi:endonuclease/exonuclease/phosphatase family metal-dependent hydrolase
MRVLSLNVGLLDCLFGRIRPTPFVEERLRALPQTLFDLEPDIVALQEIYSASHCQWLQTAVAHHYPYVGRIATRGVLGLANSLLVLSRFPLKSRLTLFDSAPLEERLFDRKGVLCLDISLPIGQLTLHNLHTTAGGLFRHPEHSVSDRYRERQLNQVFKQASESKGLVTLIVGDVNAGPGVSDENYRLFETNGYTDLHSLANGGLEEPTWEPTNPLNIDGPHRTSPPQRIDHIFARTKDVKLGRCVPTSSKIVLREPRVVVQGKKSISVSDHYGIMTELALRFEEANVD